MVKKKKSVPTRTDVFDNFIGTDEDRDQKLEASMDEVQIKSNEKKQQAVLDTSEWFKTEGRRPRRVAMTFTLDPKVIDLIEKAADKHKLSRSRIVEKIAFNTLD